MSNEEMNSIHEDISSLHENLGEIRTDVRWLVDMHKHNEVKLENSKLHRVYMILGATPIIISLLLITATYVKDIDILCLLHKDQMQIYKDSKDNPYTLMKTLH
jgi:hypothetical protein